MKSSDVTYFHSGLVEIIHLKNCNLSYSEHNHISIYTIGIIIKGEMLVHQRNKVSTYVADNYFIISPYEPHSCESADTYELLSICIKKDFIDTNTSSTLSEIIRNIILSSVEQGLFPQLNLCLIDNAIHSIYLQEKENISLDYEYISTIKNYLEQYPESEIKVEQLANNIRLSKYHFIREFKKVVGLTPHKFQIQNRIRKSQQLLNNNISLTDVALATGFYDQSHFIKHFKNLVGFTPSDYKESCIPLVRDL